MDAYVARFGSSIVLVGPELPTGIKLADACHPAIWVDRHGSGYVTGYLSVSDDFWVEAQKAPPHDKAFAVQEVGGPEAVQKIFTRLIERWGGVNPGHLVGLAEAAEILGWDKRKLAVYRGRGLLPEPIAELASGPIWLREQIEAYKAAREQEEEHEEGQA